MKKNIKLLICIFIILAISISNYNVMIVRAEETIPMPPEEDSKQWKDDNRK